MKTKIKLGLIFVTLIFVSTPVYAMSFGTFVKTSEIDVLRGQSGYFDILFFSKDKEPTQFLLSLKEHPDGFVVNYPKGFVLDSSEGNDYILIENEYVRVKDIRINVDVPDDAALGVHSILLKATSTQNGQQGSIGVNAEKAFLLKVNVISDGGGGMSTPGANVKTVVYPEQESTTSKESQMNESSGDYQPITGNSIVPKVEETNLIYVCIALAFVALIAFAIYKYS